MARTRGDGGGKTERPLNYKPTHEAAVRFERLIAEKIERTPAIEALSRSVWVAELMGFTERNLIQAADRLRLAGHDLTPEETQQINNLGELITLWPNLQKQEQRLYAVRIESLLKDVRRLTGANGGTDSESGKESKQARQAPRKIDLKAKSA